MFGDGHLFAKSCERAAAILHHLLVGRERLAIEAARHEKVLPRAEKAVEAYVARCTAAGAPIVVAQCAAIHEATLNACARRYPAVELSAEMYAVLETYYAMRATMFYFGLMALPVRQVTMMRQDEIDTISSAFSFEAFCVVIYDLMRTGYQLRNVTLLARDTFLVERLFPSSSVLKAMGMLEKPCTNIKGLITTILKVAQPHGISPHYVTDTTLTWTELAELATQPEPARRVVEALVVRRAAQLHALRAVRPPSPERPLPAD